MARSIGHDEEWEREVFQDLDEHGHVRITTSNVTVVFRGGPPTPEQITQVLAAHAPTDKWEVRQAEIAARLAEKATLIDSIVLARCPPSTPREMVDEERQRVTARVLALVESEHREDRRALRGQREERGEHKPFRPVPYADLLVDRLAEVDRIGRDR